MADSRDDESGGRILGAFEIYLRTGRRAIPLGGRTETKFNPWHDPHDGRFTFAGRGQFFGRGSDSGGRASSSSEQSSSTTATGLRGTSTTSRSSYDPRKQLADARNTHVYTIKPGDSLSRIAASRKGLTVSDLAWINGIPVGLPLRVGQRLKVPTQAWLDANRARAQELVERIGALDSYLGAHGNKLPIPRAPSDPNFRDIDTTNPPRFVDQISVKVETIELNGYHYTTDSIGRVRHVRGEIPSNLKERRSRSAQANAGGEDRLPTDDGGHYVAPRFGGAPVAINHFPQDSGINRGQYRAIEDQWDKARNAGRRVSIDITPHYQGTSLRPSRIDVVWYIDGTRHEQRVGNQRRGK